MKKLILAALVGVAFLRPADGLAKVRVVATIQDFAAIAEAVGGDDVEVVSLTVGSRDPHFAVAKPSMIRKMNRAQLLLIIGADMEIGWLPPLLQRARNGAIQPGTAGYLDLSTVIPLLDVPTGPVSRSMGDVHPKGNPHYWLDPRNGARVARAITDRLTKIDGANAAHYRARFATFVTTLRDKYASWKQALAGLKGSPVIAYHTSMAYLAAAFDFHITDEVEPKPGIAPSAAYLNQLIATIKGNGIKLMLMEPYYERRSGRFLHDRTGIGVAVVPQSVGSLPGIDDYFDLFDGIVKAINDSLGA